VGPHASGEGSGIILFDLNTGLWLEDIAQFFYAIKARTNRHIRVLSPRHIRETTAKRV